MSIPSPSEFYDRFKNNIEEGKRLAFNLGRECGGKAKSSSNIQGDDLEAVADVLNTTMMKLNMGGRAKVEENRVVMRDTSLCTILRTSMTLGIPWEWLDSNMIWPYLDGLVSTIRPDMKQSVPSMRCRGDKVCMSVFEIECEKKERA